MSKIASFVDEHEAFAASRVSQYVFVPAKEDVFTFVDQHADTLDGDIKAPLVLVGNEGMHKACYVIQGLYLSDLLPHTYITITMASITPTPSHHHTITPLHHHTITPSHHHTITP
jgi:hypothetical protein